MEDMEFELSRSNSELTIGDTGKSVLKITLYFLEDETIKLRNNVGKCERAVISLKFLGEK